MSCSFAAVFLSFFVVTHILLRVVRAPVTFLFLSSLPQINKLHPDDDDGRRTTDEKMQINNTKVNANARAKEEKNKTQSEKNEELSGFRGAVMRQFYAWMLPAVVCAATELKRAPRKLVDLTIFNLHAFFASFFH